MKQSPNFRRSVPLQLALAKWLALTVLLCLNMAPAARGEGAQFSPHYPVRYIAETHYFDPANLSEKQDVRNVGGAGIASKDDAMYRYLSIIAQAGAKADADLTWLFNNGTPQGKLYATLLVQRYDQKKGDAYLTAMESSKFAKNAKRIRRGELVFKRAANVPADAWSAKEPPMDAMLWRMMFVRAFATQRITHAALPSVEYPIYERVLQRKPPALAQLEFISRYGSPAGQLYGALALYKLDKPAGIKAFQRLSKSTEIVQQVVGKKADHRRVADISKEGISGELSAIYQ